MLLHFLVALAAIGLTMTALWVLSLRLRDASIVDVFWGPAFVLVAAISVLLAAPPHPRSWLLLGLVALWGLRLGAHIFWRNHGRGEDRRYRAMRAARGDRFASWSLIWVFWAQAALVAIVSLPIQVTAWRPGGALGWLDGLGVAVWFAGFLFESVGDAQLRRFQREPANRGRVLESGLWRLTRHPNYFGDCLVWWGIFLVALGTPWGFATVVGPLVMTWLLRAFSGVPLLERDIAERRPGYAEYVRRTSAFVPWWPRPARPVDPAEPGSAPVLAPAEPKTSS